MDTSSQQNAMRAALNASRKIDNGRWIRGAATHVLAEFLTELEKSGWRLVEIERSEPADGRAMPRQKSKTFERPS